MSHKHHHHEPQKDMPAAAPEAMERPSVSIPSDDTNEKLRGELDQAKDRALRLQAELDNYRKRASRELEDRLKYADMDILRELLPVLDNIQRAVEHAGNTSDPGSLLAGFKMVGHQLESVLEKRHCKRSKHCTRSSIRTCIMPYRKCPRPNIRRIPFWWSLKTAINCTTAWCVPAR